MAKAKENQSPFEIAQQAALNGIFGVEIFLTEDEIKKFTEKKKVTVQVYDTTDPENRSDDGKKALCSVKWRLKDVFFERLSTEQIEYMYHLSDDMPATESFGQRLFILAARASNLN